MCRPTAGIKRLLMFAGYLSSGLASHQNIYYNAFIRVVNVLNLDHTQEHSPGQLFTFIRFGICWF